MWGLLALTATVFLGAKCLGFREPSQARAECGLGILISLHLQTDIQYRIHRRRDIPTPLALHLALQLTQEGCVDDTIARNVRRATGGGVDLIQCRDEKLVGVLLRVSSQFRRSPPRGSQKRNWSIWSRFTGVDLRK